MSDAAVSPSHGSFFRRKRGPFLAQKSPPANEDLAAAAATAATATTEHPSDAQRPSTALSRQSSHTESAVSSSLIDSQPGLNGRSASVRSPKARSPYAPFGDVFSAGLAYRRSTSASTRQFPPSAFFHRQRASESAAGSDAHTGESRQRNSSIEQSPTRGTASGPTSPQASRRDSNPRLPATAFSSSASGGDGATRSMTVGLSGSSSGGQNSGQALFQHIQSVSSKRISSLDYLRQVHQGDVYWFTTFQFQKSDLSKIPYFEPRKLARRATNYLLLGVSLPAILDPNADSATEYLRAFNALLTEFEGYQNIHSVDGQPTGSFGKSRIPQLFRRATHGSGPKSRRTSNPAEPHPSNGYDGHDTRSGSNHGSIGSTSFSSFTSDTDLLPGEDYNFLLTPFLPFEPDYFETFVTLCDVLIDCYARIRVLISGPSAIQPGVGDLFSKVDAKVRKLFIAGLVQEIDEATKQGIKAELAGVGKVVLGGLLG